LKYQDSLKGSRVLTDRYGENVLSIAVTKGKANWLAYAADFIRDARGSGLLKQIVVQSGICGVDHVL
jgi:hypothetical protein